MIKYKKKGLYKVLEDISENINLLQLMDSLGNVNHAISVLGYWIFDSNYEKALVLNGASLDMIFAPSIGEGQAAKFELVFTAVRYIRSSAQLKRNSCNLSVKTQSYPRVFLYERLKVIILICFKIPIQKKPTLC